MEAWKEELYHWGVKGMKWRRRKSSAIANEYRSDARENADAVRENILSGDRSRSTRENTLYNIERRRRNLNTAAAIENGRPAPRRKRYDGFSEGKGLYKREKVKNNRPTSRKKNVSGKGKGLYKRNTAKRIIRGL